MTTGLIVGAVDGTLTQTGTLNLNGASAVAAGTFLGGTNGIAAVNVGNSGVITANESIKAILLTVGGGTSGSLNLAAGKNITGNVAIDSGATLTFNDSGSLVSGTILGVSDGVGTLSLAENFTTISDIGSGSNSLSVVLVGNGKTLNLTSGTNIDSTNVNLGTGSILNFNGGILTGAAQGSVDNVGTVNFHENNALGGDLYQINYLLIALTKYF